MIYFDYNATTRLDPDVRAAMMPFLEEIWANPSSVHREGRRARAALDEARERIATVFHCKPSEIIFTSGGTESANQAILGAARRLKSRGRHLLTSSIEHHCVLHCFDYLKRCENFEVTCLPVDRFGRISPDDVRKAIRSDTILVSVMAANNEIGTVMPISEIGAICRERGVLFHTDAVQWFGKLPLAGIDFFNADLVSICAHKFHGPKGSGALFIRSPLQIEPLIHGGAHENERRAGTENLCSIIGMAEAVERFIPTPVFPEQALWQLTHKLIDTLSTVEGVHFVGHSRERLPNTASFVVERADSIALLAGLDLAGVCASSGSACSSGSLVPSHVVQALGFDDKLAHSLVRFSLGRESTMNEVSFTTSVFPEIVRRSQATQ